LADPRIPSARNPVSCLCAYDFRRAIRRRVLPPAGRIGLRRCTVARKIVSRSVVTRRVRLVSDEVEPIALSGASILSSTTRADGFVIVPAESEGYGPGAEVTVFLYD
jgi:molybdopterin molybdotransferase